MWHDPYLETCCRSALHRVMLCGTNGRPQGLKDGPCLARLQTLGFVAQRHDGHFVLTPAGRSRHATEILRRCARRA